MRQALATALLIVSVTLTTPALAADAFTRAEKIIKDHALLTPKAERCSKLVLRDDNSKRIAKIGVYEQHNAACGGDPDVEHRLFDLEIDMKTGVAKWDNNPDMEMRPVPKRRR